MIGFRALANYFDPERPFYALQPQGLDGEQPCLTTVEEMAAHFISEVRTVQPKGLTTSEAFPSGAWLRTKWLVGLPAKATLASLLALLDTYATNLEPEAMSFLRALFSSNAGN